MTDSPPSTPLRTAQPSEHDDPDDPNFNFTVRLTCRPSERAAIKQRAAEIKKPIGEYLVSLHRLINLGANLEPLGVDGVDFHHQDEVDEFCEERFRENWNKSLTKVLGSFYAEFVEYERRELGRPGFQSETHHYDEESDFGWVTRPEVVAIAERHLPEFWAAVATWKVSRPDRIVEKHPRAAQPEHGAQGDGYQGGEA